MKWHKTETDPPSEEKPVIVNCRDLWAVMTYSLPDQHGYCWSCSNGGSGWTMAETYWTELPEPPNAEIRDGA